MKKWKTALTIVPLVLLLSVALYYLPTENFVKNLPILRSFYTNTTMEIVTPNGKAKVVIDGKEYGETPVNVQSLLDGDHTVELTRSGSEESFYKTHTLNVPLTKNTTSRINMEIGPEDYLYGTILYYTSDSIYTESKGKITVTSNAENSKIYLNKEFLKTSPITNIDLNPGEYEITVSAQDHESASLPIVIREGLTLNVKAYLLPVPVTFETTNTDE